MKAIKLVKKVLGGKKQADKAAKKAKKKLRMLSYCFAFCAGAALTGYICYQNREKLAVMTIGRRNIKPRKLLKILRKK